MGTDDKKWWECHPLALSPDPSKRLMDDGYPKARKQWTMPKYDHSENGPGVDHCIACHGDPSNCPLNGDDWRMCPHAR